MTLSATRGRVKSAQGALSPGEVDRARNPRMTLGPAPSAMTVQSMFWRCRDWEPSTQAA